MELDIITWFIWVIGNLSELYSFSHLIFGISLWGRKYYFFLFQHMKKLKLRDINKEYNQMRIQNPVDQF